MLANEQLLDDLAGAILDGAEVDWVAAESIADDTARLIIQHLRLVSSVAQVHRNLVPAEDGALPPVVDGTFTLDRWGHLRILDPIGRGAFGEVFRAWDTRLDREVALKLLPASPASGSDDESAIIREGRLLARVRHPNVVTIYGAEQIDGRVGLWMEFIRGRTLEQLLRQGTVFQTREVVAIGAELCHAVSAVHAAGLLHRDIKAHNVVRADDGRVVLMDFGAGRELDDGSSSDLAGTPLYLAPEVLNGGPATVQSDIYSLGVLLYHLITGSYPVQGRTIHDVRQAHAKDKRVGIGGVLPLPGPTVARVIERATHPLPERRYESVGALGADLADVQRRPGKVLRYALAAAAVVLIALMALEASSRLRDDQRASEGRVDSLVMLASPVERFRVAVLPFRNVGSEPDNDLVDRFTFSLIGQLGTVQGLRVRGPESSFRLKNNPRTVAEIGNLLNVSHVVQGDAQLSGGTLILHASLVPVGASVPLWSRPIERRLESEGDLVGVVEQLAREIANQLALKPGPTQRQNVTTDLDTFRKYLKAHELLDGRGPRAREAVALYEEVIRADPNYAPALAELATAYGYLGLFYPDGNDTYMNPTQAVANMDGLVAKALENEPQLAEAHAANGLVKAFGLRWAEAERSFKKAIELDPTSTHVYSDFVLSTLLPLGRLDEAIGVMEKALEIDPLSLDARRTLSNTQLHAGLYSDALDNCQRVLDVDPEFPYAEDFCMWARLFNGEKAEALEYFEARARGKRQIGVQGWVHAIKRERAQAEAIAALPRFDRLPQRRAEIYGLMGDKEDKERVLEALEKLAWMNPIRAGHELTNPAVGLRGDPRADNFRRKHLHFPE